MKTEQKTVIFDVSLSGNNSTLELDNLIKLNCIDGWFCSSITPTRYHTNAVNDMNLVKAIIILQKYVND